MVEWSGGGTVNRGSAGSNPYKNRKTFHIRYPSGEMACKME